MSAWWKQGVLYQIYPRSFCDSDGDGIGDIAGITQKVDYIKDLGATIVWLSPIFASPGDDNGYDISDYRAINPEFGTMDDFKEMLDAFHAAGIKVILDLVVNHTSDEHEWFIKSRDKNSPYRDYYIWRDSKDGGDTPPNNWTSFFTGSAWQKDYENGDYYLHLFSKKQPDLNWENPKVREEVKSIMRFWLDMGVDGFRCDVINLISKADGLPDGTLGGDLVGIEHYANGPRVHEYLNELNRDVLSKYDCFTVGELGVGLKDAEKYVAPSRKELDMIIHFEHMNADCKANKWFPKKFSLTQFKKALNEFQHIDGWTALYLENHDQPRSVSRYGDDIKFRKQTAKMLAAAIFLQKGTPFIYQGQEIGMTNAYFKTLDEYRDVETHNVYHIARKRHIPRFEIMRRIKIASRDNARTPMQWDGSENAGFGGEPWLKINPNYTEINAVKDGISEDSITEFYKSLFLFRAQNSVIIEGDYTDLAPEHKNIYTYLRTDAKTQVLVVCNFSGKNQKFSAPSDVTGFTYTLGNYESAPLEKCIVLKPYETRVYINTVIL